MLSPGGVGANVAPNVTKLETSRSIRRSLLSSSSEDSPSGGRRCTTPSGAAAAALELSPQSRSSFKAVVGDEPNAYGFVRTARISWIAYFVLATFAFVLILLALGINRAAPPRDWKSESVGCSSSTFFPSRLPSLVEHKEEEYAAFLPAEPHPVQQVKPSNSKIVPMQVDRHRDPKLKATFDGEEEEDGNCRSRTRHLKFRRADRRHPPSRLLDNAFVQYASMHARCTAGKNWDEAFTDNNNNNYYNHSRNQSVLNHNDSCKYLMYIEGWEGLGNRLLSLVSAFTYALVTDRVLLLDSRRNMPGLLCEPFRGSSWYLPVTFPYEKVDALPTLGSINTTDGEIGVPALNVHLRHVQSDSDQRFFCPDVQRRLNDVPWIGWTSNQYYVPRLLTIPTFWTKFSPIFDDPSRVFTQLSRYLILPRNPIWARTERIFRAYLAPSRKLVGIQLRTPRAKAFEQPMQDRIMRCLVGDLILPKVSQEELQQVGGRLTNTRDLKTEITEADEQDTSIFVASLQRQYFEALKELYTDRGTEDGTLVGVYTMAADSEGQENTSYEQSVRALVDIWLLSFSDSLVTSSWSTFGYVAQGLGGVQPYIINTDLEQRESCGIGQSAEPCNHFPFLSTCSNSQSMSAEHAIWIQQHVKACPDEPNGLQLVSNYSS